MDIPELFISYDNYNFYYSEQVYLAESLKNKSYFFLESTDDILQKSLHQLDCEIYRASAEYYQKAKSNKNREILEQIVLLLGLSSTINIKEFSDSDVIKYIDNLRSQYDLLHSN
ncbi:hypothetical protein [Flectobacillus sp. BAB-3569]|jgi:hypothetical protein|uniref:hypothetical protein n=1 Tax=Flectobacillus sp. BAB-3569 TaxID=1509483 RepID=UPI000BA42026|nr:hypothetical protein [Flectobacillus sp. BAB-3569]PAC33385.1 hypothetical protein BWI92_02420 [Flectobacillus sp. BAB-3569]